MGDLQEQKQALDAALQANRRALRSARQQARCAATSRSNTWHLTTSLQNTTLIIYVMAENDVEPAVQFLQTTARTRRWPDKPSHEVGAVVQDLFLTIDISKLVDLTDPNDPSDPAALREAAGYVQEWRVCKWVRDLNKQQGVAPSTEAVLQRLEEERRRLPEAARPLSRGTSADAGARMWACRFRRRWGGRYGAIRIRDEIPLQELRDKAFRTCKPWGIIFGINLGPPGGPKATTETQ